jgi:hypothetical protein
MKKRNSKILSDHWVDRKYVMKNFPISHRTYNKKVEKLDTESYIGYTFIGKHNKRFIDKSILDTIFLSDRIPNYNQPHNIRKWVIRKTWDFIGNFTPDLCDIDSNVSLVNELYKILRKNYTDLVLFYSVVKDKWAKNNYHTHFLIRTTESLDLKKIVHQIKENELLNLFLFPKESKINNRLRVDKYDMDTFQTKGLNYTLKFEIKTGLLKRL